MAALSVVSVLPFKDDGKKSATAMPQVLLSPIRPDIVNFVHTNMAKNKRQPYAVKHMAGMGHSAESWGTGRAVARIPRVSGGGTSRSGQAAFGNMCRKGRMFAPTKIWRKWHRKINTNQKRYAVASALAASATTSFVLGRGHRVEKVAQIPLVVDTGLESVKKTKEAVKALRKIGAYNDVLKVKDSRKIRAGAGKMRNRRYVQRRGPLVVFKSDNGITRAFRNLPGVELANVERLNLLQLAPGGHIGRFIIWTQAAFDSLSGIWGSANVSSQAKAGYTLPRSLMTNSDLARIINSDEVQSKLRAPIKSVPRAVLKRNPLKNMDAMLTLNPYANVLRKAEQAIEARRVKAKIAKAEATRAKKKVAPTAEEKAAIAQAKAHAEQQKINFARISKDDFKEPKAKEVKEPAKKQHRVPELPKREPRKRIIRKRKAVVEEEKEEEPKKEAGKAEAKKEAGKAEAKKEAGKAEAKKEAGKKEEPKKGKK